MKKLNRVIGIDLLVDSAFELLLGSPEHERVSLSQCRWHHCSVPHSRRLQGAFRSRGETQSVPQEDRSCGDSGVEQLTLAACRFIRHTKAGTLMDRAATVRRSLESCGLLVNRLTRSCSGSVY